MCNRERRPEVEIENGAVKVAVKDRHDAPRVWVAVGDDDRTERSLTERALNAGESESGTGNERPPASSTLGIRLRGGGLVLGGKGEHLHVLGYTVGPAELMHSLVSRTTPLPETCLCPDPIMAMCRTRTQGSTTRCRGRQTAAIIAVAQVSLL